MKVIIIQKIFSHYRKLVFDKISKEFDLILISTDYHHSVSPPQSSQAGPCPV